MDYTTLSLQSNSPLNAIEAFDEAFGYRTEAQCNAIRSALINSNDALVAGIVRDLYAAAILRNEELADIERDLANEREDQLRNALKHFCPAPAFPGLKKKQVIV